MIIDILDPTKIKWHHIFMENLMVFYHHWFLWCGRCCESMGKTPWGGGSIPGSCSDELHRVPETGEFQQETTWVWQKNMGKLKFGRKYIWENMGKYGKILELWGKSTKCENWWEKRTNFDGGEDHVHYSNAHRFGENPPVLDKSNWLTVIKPGLL